MEVQKNGYMMAKRKNTLHDIQNQDKKLYKNIHQYNTIYI